MPRIGYDEQPLWASQFGRNYKAVHKDQAVVAMGDFNDEPFNRALVAYALSERVERRVKSKRSQNPYLLNLTWNLMGKGVGTHYYDGTPGMLDQILVNRPVRPNRDLGCVDIK